MVDEKMGGYHNQKNELVNLRKALTTKDDEIVKLQETVKAAEGIINLLPVSMKRVMDDNAKLQLENEVLRLAMTRIPKQTTLFHVRQECKDALAAISAAKGEGE